MSPPANRTDPSAPEAVQRSHQDPDERADAALEAARRSDARHLAHEEAQIEAAGLHQKALPDVGMPSQITPGASPRSAPEQSGLRRR